MHETIELHHSILAKIPEAMYRSPDIARARNLNGQSLAMSKPGKIHV